MCASLGTTQPRSAHEPPVVCIRSAVAMFWAWSNGGPKCRTAGTPYIFNEDGHPVQRPPDLPSLPFRVQRRRMVDRLRVGLDHAFEVRVRLRRGSARWPARQKRAGLYPLNPVQAQLDVVHG